MTNHHVLHNCSINFYKNAHNDTWERMVSTAASLRAWQKTNRDQRKIIYTGT